MSMTDDLPTTLPMAHQLALAGVQLCPTGVLEVGDATVEDLVDGLGRLARSESWSRFVAGDLFLALVAAHDGDPAPAFQAVAPLGYSRSWLATAIEVARRVPRVNRRGDLSWGHHEVIARDSIVVDEQVTWLRVAVDGNWTIAELTAAVDRWERRDQGELDGVNQPPPVRAKVPPSLVRAIGEAMVVNPHAWLMVHPETGQVRVSDRGDGS